MGEISCPHCNFILGVSDCSGADPVCVTLCCPECGDWVGIYDGGIVEWVPEVDAMSEADNFEQYCEMKADFKREEGY